MTTIHFDHVLRCNVARCTVCGWRITDTSLFAAALEAEKHVCEEPA